MHYVIWMNLCKKETKIRGLLIAKSNNASSNLYLSGHIIAKWLKYSLYDNFMKNSWIYCMFLCTTLIRGTNTATFWLCKYVFSVSKCFNNTLQDKKVPTTCDFSYNERVASNRMSTIWWFSWLQLCAAVFD